MAERFQAVIIGAGFGGMGAAIQLKRQGIDDFVVLEREDDLGGTWHVNRYPGLAVDIASVTYSYSFVPNPWLAALVRPRPRAQEVRRARRRHVRPAAAHALRHGGRRRHTGTRTADEWEVAIAGGPAVRAAYLITATGFLSQPRTPDIAGVDSFAGTVVHTAKWDDTRRPRRQAGGDHRHRRDRRPADPGARAPRRAPDRLPADPDLGDAQAGLRDPGARCAACSPPRPGPSALARRVNTALLELIMVAAVLNYRRANLLNRGAAAAARRHLHKQVADPELRRKLTPDYSFGCKRPTFSNDYYPAFTRPDVHLETAGDRADHARRHRHHRRPRDRRRRARAGHRLRHVGRQLPGHPVVGRDGKDLGRWWRETRFQAYEGIAVPGFPNFLSLASPYSYSGLSYFTTIEGQMKHMGRLLTEVQRRGAATFEVRDPANEEFLGRVTELLEDSVFNLGSCATARSYYFNQHGEAALLRPTSTISAHREAESFPLDDYAYAVNRDALLVDQERYADRRGPGLVPEPARDRDLEVERLVRGLRPARLVEVVVDRSAAAEVRPVAS